MQKFQSIQVLRALAANMVVVFHFVGLNARIDPSYRAIESAIANLGIGGVHCFFVISGFVITTVAQREHWRQFLFSRIVRIYPIYWVYLALMVAFYLARGWPDPAPAFLNSVFLLPATTPLLPVGWSLVHEVYFYAVVALALALGLSMVRLLTGWAVLIVVAQLFTTSTNPVLQIVTHPYTIEFIAGGFIALANVRRHGLAILVTGAALVAVGQPLCGLLDPSQQWLRMLLIGSPYMLVVYGAISLESTGWGAPPRWAIKLGDASYSTYLSHFLLLALLTRLFSTQQHGLVDQILFAGLCIIAANIWGVLSFNYLELPMLRIVRNKRAGGIVAQHTATNIG
ncbi:acyltransferase [Bradyrhizobium barranii subsp. apii]|uniref:Acyltransferase n=1 Tax=Bradyrhizobium barranii subsp. apii TaxID=2819348 RepID=A0A8T5VL60_9BRAD|nr:acyltransferase [Bradyrhizobium barranii]UPT90377.1 acyltransferase [Bradyrhizobium barranii subsp. apii]